MPFPLHLLELVHQHIWTHGMVFIRFFRFLLVFFYKYIISMVPDLMSFWGWGWDFSWLCSELRYVCSFDAKIEKLQYCSCVLRMEHMLCFISAWHIWHSVILVFVFFVAFFMHRVWCWITGAFSRWNRKKCLMFHPFHNFFVQ